MKKIIALALVFALITGALLLAYLKTLDQKQEQEAVQTETVIVAAKDIAPFITITDDMVTEKELPLGGATPGATASRADIVGRVSEGAILTGEQILPAKLKQIGGTQDGLAFAIPDGYRAYTIAVDEISGIGWYIREGDNVDIICDVKDLEIDEKNVTGGHAVVLVAQGCKVLHTGNAADAVPTEDGTTKVTYGSVTLLVTPEQAQRLLYASQEGSLRPLLRGVTDEADLTLGPIRLGNIVAR